MTPKHRALLEAVTCGLLLSLTTGLIQRDLVGIPELRHYGYPLVWRITNLNGPTEYIPTHLGADAAIWIAASLLVLVLLQKARIRLKALTTQAATRGMPTQMFLAYFLFCAFAMKAVSELIHEAFGHGLLVALFDGRITGISISLLWPYQLSGIEYSGSFHAWQLPWIAGGGILVCLITSSLIQALLLLKPRNRYALAPVFWLAFWTFLNPAGYLITGGIRPFGDVSQLIAAGVLSPASSLAIGLTVLASGFLSLSKIFKNMIQDLGITSDTKLRLALSFLWLTIPLTTLAAILGLDFQSGYSPLLFAMSFTPSIAALLLPKNLLCTVKSHLSR